MEKYWQIEKTTLKYQMPLHLLVCIVLLGISPLLMGVENLSAADTAKVLERYVALIGIVMLTPVFLPEQDAAVRESVYSKYIKASRVYLVRLAGNVFILGVFLAIYIFMLRHNQCGFPVTKFYFGVFAEMLFFGGLGVCFYGFSDNLVIGYMAPVVYYIAAVGGGNKYLKMFYPFSMSMGRYTEKIWLFAAAVFLLAAGIYFRCRRAGRDSSWLYNR
ncbi:hypothetical protein AALA13_17080 [Lachnospiraceae bacterium 50-23]